MGACNHMLSSIFGRYFVIFTNVLKTQSIDHEEINVSIGLATEARSDTCPYT